MCICIHLLWCKPKLLNATWSTGKELKETESLESSFFLYVQWDKIYEVENMTSTHGELPELSALRSLSNCWQSSVWLCETSGWAVAGTTVVPEAENPQWNCSGALVQPVQWFPTAFCSSSSRPHAECGAFTCAAGRSITCLAVLGGGSMSQEVRSHTEDTTSMEYFAWSSREWKATERGRCSLPSEWRERSSGIFSTSTMLKVRVVLVHST